MKINRQKQNSGSKNKSIRTQMVVYIGLFVVLPLCLGLMFLNIYLQRMTNENKLNYDISSLSQIKDNADQMIEVTNYSTSMMIANREIMDNLRLMERSSDKYELHLAKTNLSNRLFEIESSVLNAVDGKIAILTNSGYLIGSHNLSKSKLTYENENWYKKILENGRKTTFCTDLSSFFKEMTSFPLKDYEYLYIGRSIQGYSGENLGILMIQLSSAKIWGKFVYSMIPAEKGGLYILNEDHALQMSYNTGSKEFIQTLSAESNKWDITQDQVSKGILDKNIYYMAISLEHSGNSLIYTMPQNVFLEESYGITQGILVMIVILILSAIVTMIYLSGRLSRPLRHVADCLEQSKSGIINLEEPHTSFLEIHQFISSYNRAGHRIEKLIEQVKLESHLKEKAHYEMLMSQISPHFIFNTVNSIRIMAKEEKDLKTERALESLGEILHGVYKNKNGMTTVGQEAALLQAYVDIMRVRFGNSFQYYNVIPTELNLFEIPAFTMQPIVENAILHGVKDLKAGQIIVSAVEYPNDFVISIFDNGTSLDKEIMDRLLKNPQQSKSSFTGIGLYNVNMRLKMLYGESYGLIFNEQVKTGFELWIRIPKRSLREYGKGIDC